VRGSGCAKARRRLCFCFRAPRRAAAAARAAPDAKALVAGPLKSPPPTHRPATLSHAAGGSHVSTLRQLRLWGLCHAPFGWYRAGVPDAYPRYGSA